MSKRETTPRSRFQVRREKDVSTSHVTSHILPGGGARGQGPADQGQGIKGTFYVTSIIHAIIPPGVGTTEEGEEG